MVVLSWIFDFVVFQGVSEQVDSIHGSTTILPAQTENEFIQDSTGRWYIIKASNTQKRASRFRTAHTMGKLTMTTDEIMALTRGEAWQSS